MLRSISEEPLQDQYKVYVRNSRGRDARGLLRARSQA